MDFGCNIGCFIVWLYNFVKVIVFFCVLGFLCVFMGGIVEIERECINFIEIGILLYLKVFRVRVCYKMGGCVIYGDEYSKVFIYDICIFCFVIVYFFIRDLK